MILHEALARLGLGLPALSDATVRSTDAWYLLAALLILTLYFGRKQPVR